MFKNVEQFLFPICIGNQPKEFHYKMLINQTFIPIVYVPKEQYGDDGLFVSISQSYPSATGIIVAIQYINNYE